MQKDINMRFFRAMEKVPTRYLKKIEGGRLKGKTSIDPQWRNRVLTEVFGPCGQGWKKEIVRTWTEPGPQGTVAAFVQINLYWREHPNDPWSDPIPGIGGNQFISASRDGLYLNDEAFKMAETDAMSVACKALGVASLIYEGAFDGDKYSVDTQSQGQIRGKGQGFASENKEVKKIKEKIGRALSYKEIVALAKEIDKVSPPLSPAEIEEVHREALKALNKINEVDLTEWTRILSETNGEDIPELEKGIRELAPSVQKSLAMKFSRKFPNLFKEAK